MSSPLSPKGDSKSDRDSKDLDKQKKDLAKLKAKLEKDAKKQEKKARELDLKTAKKGFPILKSGSGETSDSSSKITSPRSSAVELVDLSSPTEILAQTSAREQAAAQFEPTTVLIPEKASPLSPSKVLQPSTDKSTPLSSPHPERKVSLADFKVLKLIGKGGYGEVYLVEHRGRKQKLALKVMEKRLIAEQNKIQHILNERDVLVKSKINPFLVHLWFSFQDENYLYFAMEFCAGGDLRSLLNALGTLTEEEAKLYFAEMIIAVSTLHQMGYIHRDLKPDNFLIDEKGHLKLADFGLSKHGIAGSRGLKSERLMSRRSILLGDQQLEQLNQDNFNKRFVRTRSFSTLHSKAPSLGRPLGQSGAAFIGHGDHMTMSYVPGSTSHQEPKQPSTGMIDSFTYVPGSSDQQDMMSTYSGPSTATTSLTASSPHPYSVSGTGGTTGPRQPPMPPLSKDSPNTAQRRRMLAYSIVGSPDYMSPEVLNEAGYSHEVDWWSLGCNFFEMIMGMPPFAGESPQEVFENIQNWRTVLPSLMESYKAYMSPPCWSLITGMLAEPGKRLGASGLHEFISHPFFEGLDWNNLRAEEPPFIPKLSGDDDTSYFNDNVSGIEGNIIKADAEGNVESVMMSPRSGHSTPPVVATGSPVGSNSSSPALSRQATQVINTASPSSRRGSADSVGHVRSFTFIGDASPLQSIPHPPTPPVPPPPPPRTIPSPPPPPPTTPAPPIPAHQSPIISPLSSPFPRSASASALVQSAPAVASSRPTTVVATQMQASVVNAARPAQRSAPPVPAPAPKVAHQPSPASSPTKRTPAGATNPLSFPH